MWRLAHARPALLAAVVLTLGLVGSAAAHSQYERSDPSANGVLEQAPKQLRVWFTEEPEPRFSELTVYDAVARRVATGELRVAPGEPRVLLVDLPDLTPGTYTVAWRALSAVDGHTARGAFPFTVGLDQVPAPMVIPPGSEMGGAPAPTPWGVIARWLNFLTAAIVAGAFLFLPLMLGRALRAANSGGQDGAALAEGWGAGRRVGLAVVAAAAVVGLCGGVLSLLTQAGAAADVQPWEVFGAPLATLLSTRYGWLWGGRMLLLVALAALAWWLRRPGVTAGSRGWALGLVLGGLLLLVASLNSHAAGVQQGAALAVGADWLHLVGTAVWIGGLVQLVAALPAMLAALPPALGGRVLALAIPRFSAWALAAVGALIITGLYQTWLHVGSFDALATTAYGQTLLAKLALLVPLLALGGLNLLVLSPRMASAASRGTRNAVERLGGLERRFGLSVRGEVALAVLLLGTVGLLTSLEPARDALRAQGVVRATNVEELRAVLRIAPGDAGLNTFDVALFAEGRPVTDAQRVTLRLDHQQHEMGTVEQRLEALGDGHYRALSGALSMTGPWNVQLIVRRAGREDARAHLEYTATDPYVARAASAGGSTTEVPTRLIVGGVVLALGVLLLVDAIRPTRRRRQQAATMVLGCVAVTVGLGLSTLAALVPLSGEVNLPNPVAPTSASVARGQAIYQEECVVCHGVGGRGDGPLASTLNPRPADLRIHVAQHTEGQLWVWISDGVPGSAMPAYSVKLSAEDRWNVVNYLRDRFSATASAAAPAAAR